MMFYDRGDGGKGGGGTRQTSITKMFPFPAKGWIKSGPLAKPTAGGAEVLDNIFPTTQGGRLRKGSIKHATIDAATTHLMIYDAGGASKMFAADATKIYDVSSPADPDVAPAAAVTGQTSGDYCSFQVATSGGEFLLAFNGADLHRVYNGSTWAQNSPAITGVSSADVPFGWKWKSFVWLIEQQTMDAWYLPTGAIGGAATVFPLGGVFQNGGALLFGATWSQDSGDGLDDYCLFFTTEGEVAVYQGTNPASASDFSLVGVYRIGKPVHKNAWQKSGGDILVITDDGIIPISSAVSLDRTGLMSAAITFPIEEAWRLAMDERSGTDVPFTCTLWHAETMFIVGLPTFGALQPVAFVMNSRTGAWCRYVGWDIRCSVIFEDRLYFGTAAGTVVKGEISGADEGQPYTGVVIPLMDTFGNGAEKNAIAARVVARTNYTFTPQMFACADYQIETPTPLSADSDDDANTWDSGIWDSSTWGQISDRKASLTQWQDVAATGHAMAPGLQITTGRVASPDIELIALHLQAEVGQVFADG